MIKNLKGKKNVVIKSKSYLMFNRFTINYIIYLLFTIVIKKQFSYFNNFLRRLAKQFSIIRIKFVK